MSQRNDEELMAAAWAGHKLTNEEQNQAKQAFSRQADPNSLGGRLLQRLASATMSAAKPRNPRPTSMPWNADEADPRNQHSVSIFYDGAGYPVDANGTRIDDD